MKKTKMTGQKFGRLTVIECAPKTEPHIQWVCHCDCGGKTITRGTLLRSGLTIMCLACAVKLGNKASTKHGMYGTPEYQAWQSMIQRCTNPQNCNFKRYGARGITVCEEWRHSFDRFFTDMGYRPAQHCSLERIINAEGYSKGNCRWATDVEQARNRRTNRYLTHNGQTLLLIEWANALNTGATAILQMLRRGKSMSQVVDFYSNRPDCHTQAETNVDKTPKVKARTAEVAKLLIQ